MSRFVSGNFTLNAQAFQAAHGFGTLPTFVRAVLVCTSNDAATGFVSGQESDLQIWFNVVIAVSASVWADTTNVYVNSPEVFVGSEADWLVCGPLTPASPTNFNNFRLKFYAES